MNLKKYIKNSGIIIMCTSSIGLFAGNMLDNPALNKVRKQKVVEHAALSLVKDSKAEAVVVIPVLRKSSNPEENKALKQINLITRQAALELIKYVKAVTGAELPLQTADKALPPGKKIILVGESSLTKARGISAENLPLEGFRIQTFPEGIAIVGRMPDKRENYNLGGGYYVLKASAAQSVRFGVYDFLERFCGVRWYYPGELGTYIPPHKKDLLIPACHYTDWPEFSKRSGAHWLVYNPSKTINNHIGAKKYSPFFRAGDSSYVEFGCHSPNNFGVHLEKNPECLELSSSGKRDERFPCYGNPKTVDLMIDDMARFYKTGEGESYKSHRSGNLWCAPTVNRVVVSPPDKPVACNCEYCKKLWRNDLNYYGQASGVMTEFTRNFAEKIAKKWPNVKVLFLPYMNYLTCPKDTKLPSNVVPFVCLTYGTANQKEPSVEKYSTRAVSDWAKAVNNKVIIWEYLCWPAENTFMPFQYADIIKKFYLKNRGKILGTFVDGHVSQGGRRAPTDMTPGGEWAYSHPTTYCWYRLMWNPEFDNKAALDEYCTLMYGPAATEMKKILGLLTSRWEKTKWKDEIKDHNIKSSQIHDETMPKAEVKKLADLLKKAEQLAGENNTFRKRLDFFGTAIKKFIEASKQYHSNNRPEMQIKRVGDNPVIDGKLNDRYWNQATKYYLQDAYSTRKSKSPPVTMLRAVWTKDGVSFGILNFESFEIVAKYTKHDDRIYEDDSIELFLQSGSKPTYFHVVANSLGAYYDEFGNDNSFNFKGIKVASVVNKKLHFWSCEIFIPFKELGITPETNIELSGNIARNRIFRYRKSIEKKFYRWHTTYRASHNDSAAFGKMKFVE
jgi:uncharacterized protein DUF4838/cellulose/xylan binding protein with CBM9 domain